MDGDVHRTCRLCFGTQVQLIDIYDEFVSIIADIISEHIGEVRKTDELPKFICSECWSKTEEFHKFHRSVQNAQDNYLSMVIKREIIECDPNEYSDPLNVGLGAVTDNYELDTEMITEPKKSEQSELEQDVDEKQITVFEFESENNHTKLEDDIELDENILSNIKQDNDEDYAAETDMDGEISVYEGGRPYIPEINVDPDQRRDLLQQFDATCDICSMNLVSLKNAITHYKKCHKMDGYIKCCRLKFKKECQVEDHIRLHVRPDMFQCPIEGCKKYMRTRLSLYVHVSDHRSRLECDICHRTFIRKKKLARHMTVHAKISCNICLKKFKTKEKLEQHLKFSHKTAEVIDQKKKLSEIYKLIMELSSTDIKELMLTHCDMTCDICDAHFKSIQEAQYHYLHEHNIREGYIRCCSLKFKDIQRLNGHLVWHRHPDALRCKICAKELRSVNSLRAHLRAHETPQADNNNECAICKAKLSSKDHLTKHMRTKHSISFRSSDELIDHRNRIEEFFDMFCELCDFQFTSLEHAKLHYLNEHKNTDGYIKCCDFKFKTNRSILDHIEFHLNPERYKCPLCEKILSRKTDLRQHLSFHRTLDQKRFTCQLCDKTFVSNFMLTRHVNRHQKDQPKTKIPCDQCRREFSSRDSLKIHLSRTHDKNDLDARSFLCHSCGKSFKTLTAVRLHAKVVHKDPTEKVAKFQCNICERKYQSINSLRFHIRLAHESKPQKCPHCGKLTTSPVALIRHIKIVHENEEFECHVCHKKLKSSISFKEHVATHTSDKLYTCSFCSDTFNWRSNMYIHQKKSHPEEWKKIPALRRRKDSKKLI